MSMSGVVLHSKPGCPHCDKAAELLNRLCVSYMKVMYSPDAEDYECRRDTMFDTHGHRSFPNIYVGDMFVGGYTELLKAYESGDLERWLAVIGIALDCDF